MNLEEARDAIGLKVVYRPAHFVHSGMPEEGVITSVNKLYVFVRYGAQVGSQATPAERLSLVASCPVRFGESA